MSRVKLDNFTGICLSGSLSPANPYKSLKSALVNVQNDLFRYILLKQELFQLRMEGSSTFWEFTP